MKFLKNKWTIIAVLLIAIGGLAAFKIESKAAPQYFTEKVQKGDIQNVVQATGTINAVTTVQVGSQVSGTIETLSADFNSHVKKNQVIAQIDPSLFQGALLQAKADLADAQANLVVSKANLDKANAAAAQAKLDFNRYTTLAQEGVVPTQQMDTARAASQSADAAVGAAKADIVQLPGQQIQRPPAGGHLVTGVLSAHAVRAGVEALARLADRAADIGADIVIRQRRGSAQPGCRETGQSQQC